MPDALSSLGSREADHAEMSGTILRIVSGVYMKQAWPSRLQLQSAPIAVTGCVNKDAPSAALYRKTMSLLLEPIVSSESDMTCIVLNVMFLDLQEHQWIPTHLDRFGTNGWQRVRVTC